MDDVDVVVVGAGHAGIEASLICAKMGLQTLLLTISLDKIGEMSCNPSIGGIGKGQLVREIDALGGQMAKVADATAIQYRILNRSKGPAVRALRAQIDRFRYRDLMKKIVLNTEGLWVVQTHVEEILINGNRAIGAKDSLGRKFYAKVIILCPGTFLSGLIHIGMQHFSGGRLNDPASERLSQQLKELGFPMGRFKTGTCPRLDARTIDFSKMIRQDGDSDAYTFSLYGKMQLSEQMPCYITYTTEETHKLIRDSLDKSPLYTGKITGTGVRYCPSLEDKIVKFPHHSKHYVFIEPEGRDTVEIYPNGISNSLPWDVQEKMVSSIPGLENAKIIKMGYGIEHDYVDPRTLYPTLESKIIENLFLAGQINGTTGYEEAAAQGVIAGINAASKILGKSPLILRRDEAYIGVLIDDLVRKGVDEPYRMLSSRVEFRLALREDNADFRLMEKARKYGLVDEERWQIFMRRKEMLDKAKKIFSDIAIPWESVSKKLTQMGEKIPEGNASLKDVLKHSGIWLNDIGQKLYFPDIDDEILHIVEEDIKYSAFIDRVYRQVERLHQLKSVKIPQDLDYSQIPSLSREARDKLISCRPKTLADALDLPGIGLETVNLLWVIIKRRNNKERRKGGGDDITSGTN